MKEGKSKIILIITSVLFLIFLFYYFFEYLKKFVGTYAELMLAFLLLIVIILQVILLHKQNKIMEEQTKISRDQLELSRNYNKLYELDLKLFVRPGATLSINYDKIALILKIELVIYNPTMRNNYIRSFDAKSKNDNILTRVHPKTGTFHYYLIPLFSTNLEEFTVKANEAIERKVEITVKPDFYRRNDITEDNLKLFTEEIEVELVDITGKKYTEIIKKVQISNELLEYIRNT